MIDVGPSRLRAQRFSDKSFTKAFEVVEWFGAMQGQEYAQTKWSIGLRAPHLVDSDVEQHLQKGLILRTHLLRPTWHFVAAKDIRWMLKLTAPRVHQASAFMYRQLEMSKQLFSKSNRIMIKILQDGKSLTRDEINEEFKRNKIIASGPRLSYIMMNGELEGLICSGPRSGKQFTYSLLEERVPGVKILNRDESLAELTLRYFTSRGPATVNDFGTWSALKVADCKAGISMVMSKLGQERVGKALYYVGKHQPKPCSIPRMILLPIYDEIIMGYKDRSVLFQYKNSLSKAPRLRYPATVMFDGQIIGTWRRVTGSKSVKTAFEFFRPLSKMQKDALAVAKAQLEAFSQVRVADLV